MAVTPVFLTGFEQGVLSTSGGGLASAVSATPPTVVAAAARNGGYGLRASTGGTAGLRTFTTPVWSGAPSCVGRLAFRFSANPIGGEAVLVESNGVNSLFFRFYLQNDGKLRAGYFGGTGAVSSVTASALALNTWHVLDWYFNGTTGTIQWQVNGVAQTDSTVTMTSGNITNLLFGQTNSSGNFAAGQTLDLDDVIVSRTAADYPIGDGKVVAARPAVDGVHSVVANQFFPGDTGGTAYTNGSTTAWQMLDDDPWTTARSTTDNIRQAIIGTANYIKVQTNLVASEPVNGVRAYLAYSSPTTTANNGGCIVTNSDTTSHTLWGAQGALADYSENTNFFKSSMILEPTSGWSVAEVNGCQFFMGFSTDIAPVPTWQSVMLEVDLSLAAASIPKAASDSFTTTDITSAQDLSAALADSGALTDANSGIALTGPSDAAALTDAPGSVVQQIGFAANDAGTVSDANAGIGLSGPADALTQSDASAYAAAAQRVDAGSLTEASSGSILAALTDTFLAADAAAIISVTAIAAADTFGLSEAAALALALALSDTSALAESALVAAALSAVDSTAVVDTLTALVQQMAAADSSTFTDTVLTLVQSNAFAASDALTLSESVPQISLARTDAWVFSELAAMTAQQNLAAADSLTLTDASQISATVLQAAVDAFAGSELAAASATLAALDSLTLLESADAGGTAFKVAVDAFALIEAASLAANANLAASDTATQSDASAMAAALAAQESVTLAEVAGLAAVLAASDPHTQAEAAVLTLTQAILASDTGILAEVSARTTTDFLSAADVFGLGEFAAASQLTQVRMLSAVVTAAATILGMVSVTESRGAVDASSPTGDAAALENITGVTEVN